MSKERQGQIALLLFKQRMREEGIRIKPNMRREVANEAKKIDVSVEETMEFLEIISREMFDEAFHKEFSGPGKYTNPDRTKG